MGSRVVLGGEKEKTYRTPLTMRHISEQRCQAASKLHISFIIAPIPTDNKASAF